MEICVVVITITAFSGYIIKELFKNLKEYEESQCSHDYIPIGKRKWKCRKCGNKQKR